MSETIEARLEHLKDRVELLEDAVLHWDMWDNDCGSASQILHGLADTLRVSRRAEQGSCRGNYPS